MPLCTRDSDLKHRSSFFRLCTLKCSKIALVCEIGPSIRRAAVSLHPTQNMSKADLPQLQGVLDDIAKIEKKMEQNQNDLVTHLALYLNREAGADWQKRLDKLHNTELKLERLYADARQQLVAEKQYLREKVASSKTKKARSLAAKVTDVLDGSSATLDNISGR